MAETVADPKDLHLTKMVAENFKRLRVVELSPNPVGITLITGRNGQGKSSAIDALLWVLGAVAPDVPVRAGELAANVRCEFGNLVFEKRQKANGSAKLEVYDRETGVRISSPATFINSLFGHIEKSIALDPISILDKQPKQRRELFVDLLGLRPKLLALEEQRAKLVAERTEHRRAVEAGERQIQAVGEVPPNLPDKPLSNDEVMRKFTEASATDRANQARRAAAAQAKRDAEALLQRVAQTDAAIANAERGLAAAKSAAAEAAIAYKDATALADKVASEVAALVDPNINDLRAEMDNVGRINAQIASRDKVAALRAARDKSAKDADSASSAIEAIDAEQQAAIKGAKWPVDGMGFSEDSLLLNGLPFEQASESEQIEALMGLVAQSGNALKVIPIRNASGIGTERKRLIQEKALKYGYGVLMEQADESGKVGIVIEDGAVAAVNGEVQNG